MDKEFDNNQDKTEEATPERREEFRKKGDIALSNELISVASLIGIISALILFYNQVWAYIVSNMKYNFNKIIDHQIDEKNIFPYILNQFFVFIATALPIISFSLFGALFATLIQFKFNITWKKINFDISKLNPISGLARIFNMQALFRILKSISKIILISTVAIFIYLYEWDYFIELSRFSIYRSIFYFNYLFQKIFWYSILLLFIIGIIDYVYQFFSMEKKLKMTKQELKDDIKKREIDSQIKNKIKKLQRDLLVKKSLDETKTATVVITNPTHYAVALKYNLEMQAPVVVAKGMDFLAVKIKKIANNLNIPIVEEKSLAKTLYHNVKIGQSIPPYLYKAVAEIIKFIYKLKKDSE